MATPFQGSEEIRFGLLPMTQPLTGHKEMQQLLDLARYLDASPFSGIFYVDHFFLQGDRYLAEPRDVTKPHEVESYTTLSALAAVTERLTVGTLVTPLPLRHPSFVARMASTIDVISGGRFILGVGAGWNPREYEAFSFPYEESFKRRFAMTIEGIQAIKLLWTTDGPVNFDGEHYQYVDTPFYPKPVQDPHPPIWLGGAGPTALKTVARYADCWSPAAPHYDNVSPEVYAEGLATICAEAEAIDRDPDGILPAFLLNTSIAERREDAWKLAEAQHLREDWKDTSLQEMQSSGVLAVGTPEDCIAHLERYVEAGVRYFTVCPIPMTVENAVNTARLYAEHVIPHFMS